MNSVLKLGKRGKDVKELTALLVQRGYLAKATDIFDARVKTAVMGFQSQNLDERGLPLKVDGIVGPVTWWALTHPRVNVVAADAPLPQRLPSGGSARGRAALKVAMAEMAAGATEVGANNSGPYVRKYLNGIIDPPADWCAAFVSWCYDQHPAGCPYGYSLGARDVLKRCRARGWVYDHRAEPPQPGDIVVWRRGAIDGWQGHVGLVVESTAGGMLYTIEGNKGGFPARVRRFSYVLRSMDTLLGFARVPD
ncbi:CHAP domain-containing protein [Hydrogenophaga sp.]|uniref:CHAP domain-containing protein n=1 Tax=Hydrogenophaga sp. TaxID=1904254 RepID=UPI003F719EF3